MSWSAEWSGSFPNLCSGTWTLYKDGIPFDTPIPFQNEEAGTFGEYATWSFGSDWDEIWDHYEDGLDCDAWCSSSFNTMLNVIAFCSMIFLNFSMYGIFGGIMGLKLGEYAKRMGFTHKQA